MISDIILEILHDLNKSISKHVESWESGGFIVSGGTMPAFKRDESYDVYELLENQFDKNHKTDVNNYYTIIDEFLEREPEEELDYDDEDEEELDHDDDGTFDLSDQYEILEDLIEFFVENYMNHLIGIKYLSRQEQRIYKDYLDAIEKADNKFGGGEGDPRSSIKAAKYLMGKFGHGELIEMASMLAKINFNLIQNQEI